ncbi:amidohydrolase [Mesorhizobium sp. M0622]|uniref:amidohydrolase n=1 Tax=Mesorhizobium sp. M0622 TaxID=2956975 RepID=UPI00333BBB5B
MKLECQSATTWVEDNRKRLSRDHQTIWSFHEPAWREYRASQWYVDRLRSEGFDVEVASAGMPTAFVANWRSPSGDGPTIATFAEYDAVPGNSQEAVPYRKARSGTNEWAAGFTEPHSAVGIGALGGILSAKYAMECHNLAGNLRFFGEPAENMCGGKPFHASHGYYKGIDAAIAWRSAPLPALSNTCALDTLCGCYWSKVYTFECLDPDGWLSETSAGLGGAAATPQAAARAPAALDALCLMYTTTKYTRDSMLPHAGSWSINEAILSNGSATADNQPPRFAQIQYSWRCPSIEMAERVLTILDANAAHVAGMTHTVTRSSWVSRTRPGLPNHGLAEIAYANFEHIGPPQWEEHALDFARACQTSLGLSPMDNPLLESASRMTHPTEAEAMLRQAVPAWQTHYGADDYVEYTWHTPTVRVLVGRPRLQPPVSDHRYPSWVGLACGGVPAIVDPVLLTAAKVIGSTIVDLLTDKEKLARCKAEFEERTGGGIGGSRWIAPLLGENHAPPINHGWPEYISTARGFEWCVPVSA